MNTIPRREHPNPQFERKNWQNLNGEWEFEFDFGVSGKERKLYEQEHFEKKITVPFCPESELSGIGYKDFMNCVWYRRSVSISEEWTKGDVILHFGAVDYKTTIYINGTEAGTHLGGYASFSFNIGAFLHVGENTITVCAEDDVRSPRQPRGKQAEEFYSHNCVYTRTTGIWQTVWLEHVPEAFIERIQVYPSVADKSLFVTAFVCGKEKLTATALYNGKEMGTATGAPDSNMVSLRIDLTELHLWEIGNGRLYDLKLQYGEDEVSSYFGMREVHLDGFKFLLNGKSIFQRLVLDQGFYPDGICTAPTEEALLWDIRLSLDAGFNGARLHQKVFEPRFLYHCDKMGYIVWGEYGSWGVDISDTAVLPALLEEWVEILHRDFNHPSIIGWCPFNETWDYEGRRQNDAILQCIYKMTKDLDGTRPCIDTSGLYHVITDIYDIHDYDQNPESFKKRYEVIEVNGKDICPLEQSEKHMGRQVYRGEAIFISEYGGIGWTAKHGAGWGYGQMPKTENEFKERYRGLTEAILGNEKIFGFCYTQLYDVEQEINGLYTYDRAPKFDMEFFKRINTQKASVED